MSSKPKHCSKVKNACKYCLERVTNQNGLQCQGACKKWAHFKCLNYTPGKISDVKAGIIKVMCPCPDCETTQVKENLVNPPYSCSNHTCAANAKGPIKCDSVECPSNKKRLRPDNNTMQCSNKACPTDAAEFQTQTKKPPPRSGSPRSPCPRSCMCPVPRPKKQPKKKLVTRMTPSNSSGSCQNSKCKNSESSICGQYGDPRTQASMVNALQEMCGTVGKLSIQLRDLMGKINKLT